MITKGQTPTALDEAAGSAPTSGPYAFITQRDMLRAADICAKAAQDPLNRGQIASILIGASRILANSSLRPSVPNTQDQTRPETGSNYEKED